MIETVKEHQSLDGLNNYIQGVNRVVDDLLSTLDSLFCDPSSIVLLTEAC